MIHASVQTPVGLVCLTDIELEDIEAIVRFWHESSDEFSHWHIMEADLRGSGISSALYPCRVKTYFDLTPIQRLIHQTRTHNVGVNRMLDKWVPVVETRIIENPDGVALPGEFHLRYMHRGDVPRFFEAKS